MFEAADSRLIIVFPCLSLTRRHRTTAHKGKVTVKGTVGTNATHTINEDERTSFTDHINGVWTYFGGGGFEKRDGAGDEGDI